jgi:UDP-N-acetylglucosamine 2-epimerase
MEQVTEKKIKSDGRTGMAQVCIAIYSRAANIHPDMVLMYGDKKLFLTGQGVVQR